MKTGMIFGALVLGVLAVPGVALADDPYDPQMRTQAARDRDRAIIRKLNQQELARVRERDARYAQGWATWKAQKGREHQGRDADADRDYAEAREDYEQRMAEWRRAVAACRAGRYEYCAR
ncbi:hypothetical protein [Novosphingobium taihuense]|uniref:Nucleoid-associated protein YgaU n=1 Tax=Novosphingobium taihuense TaxID=260085 RepID=A0A7W7EVK7_9SPHN|nr:hypothetical protein [Novosphingobium taihuense]MBB4615184.1 nucleoid-associated protein YgaU [Novosphingobium taihuense]TWH84220.1 hypothetical protein IQ25_02645 [Novosphingobium taihuense]